MKQYFVVNVGVESTVEESLKKRSFSLISVTKSLKEAKEIKKAFESVSEYNLELKEDEKFKSPIRIVNIVTIGG